MTQAHARAAAGRILVAGGDAALSDLVARALRPDGHRIRLASSSVEAGALLETERADLIVIDAALAASEVQSLLEAARRQRPAPVVLLIADAQDRSAAFETLRRSAMAAAREMSGALPGPDPAGPVPLTLDEMERAHILHVLRLSGNNKKRAARMLGINRSSLYGKLKRLGIPLALKAAPALLVAALLGIATGPATAAGSPEEKIAPAALARVSSLVDEGSPDARVPLIVQTWAAPGPEELDAVKEMGGTIGPVFGSIHAFTADVAARSVIRLARSPKVRRLSLDHEVRPSLEAAVRPPSGPLTLPARGHRGEGVGVAVLDSGISPGSDLGTVTEVDIVEPDGVAADPFGHGTHVAGIVAGTGEASLCRGCLRSFEGVAPGARLFSVKVLDGRGDGRVSGVIAGIDWVLRNHEALGIRVMVLALGHPVDESYVTDPLCMAVGQAWEAGIVVVVAAGNHGGSGHASIVSPGNHPGVITVGAAEDWDSEETSDDIVAPFSSLGPTLIDGVLKPDILAPGTRVISLRSSGSLLDEVFSANVLRLSDYISDPPFGDGPSPYISLSGTSTAAPAVAAAAAILLAQDSDATPEDIKARLMLGARKLNDSIAARGAGLLDIGRALELGEAGVAVPRAASPRLRIVYDERGIEEVAFEEIGVTWGDPRSWPSELVWGDEQTWGIDASWIDLAVWSEPDDEVPSFLPEGDLAVWGFR